MGALAREFRESPRLHEVSDNPRFDLGLDRKNMAFKTLDIGLRHFPWSVDVVEIKPR